MADELEKFIPAKHRPKVSAAEMISALKGGNGAEPLPAAPTLTASSGSDPAPNPVALHQDRITALVHQISLSATDGLREHRNAVDAVMRATGEWENRLSKEIKEFGNYSSTILTVRDSMSESLKSLEALIPTTYTKS